MLKVTRTMWPWVLGIALGLVAGTFYVGLSPAGAGGEDVVVYEVDFNKEPTPADLDELIRFSRENPGVDLILKPAEGFVPLSGEKRRERDQLRAAEEEREMAARVPVKADGELAPCVSTTKSWAALEPGRQLMCNGEVVSAPPRISFRRALSAADLEELLRRRMYDLLDGVTLEEKQQGFYSYFSNGAALQWLSIDSDGAVAVDFNDLMESQVSHLSPGYATHMMLQQIFRTLFQFRDVSAVQLTLNGSCEAFGDMIGGPCQDIDRELWELMMQENQENVKFFRLEGVK